MQYDDIIVGAGSSGSVLAARLSEDPERSVLLLEAGPDYTAIDATPADLLDSKWISVVAHDWRFTATPLAGRTIEYPRGKVTGGSSAVNGAMAIRGVPADYDEWAALGNDQWDWQGVLPYLRRLEDDQDEGGDFHGTGGPIPVRRWKSEELLPLQRAYFDVLRGMGYPDAPDQNHPEATGVGPWPMNIRDGIRVSTAIGYLLSARSRLNLTIRPHCLVNRVLFEGNRAVGVEVESGGVMQKVYGKRITLSAGSVVSPAILMRSGIGPKADLLTHGIEPLVDLPGVGANLIDHPNAGVLMVPKPGVCSKDQTVVQIGLRYTAGGSDEFNDMQLYMISQADLTEIPAMMEFVGAPVVFGVTAVLQRPRSRGRVTLRSADPHDQMEIELNYLDHPEDLRRMLDGMRLAWRVATSPEIMEHAQRVALLSEEVVQSDEALAGYLKMTVNTLYHPVGTAKMGPDRDAMAVVDQHCRVRGVEALRVVDASVMPNIVRANTNLTCIMIGEKVAGWMRQEG